MRCQLALNSFMYTQSGDTVVSATYMRGSEEASEYRRNAQAAGMRHCCPGHGAWLIISSACMLECTLAISWFLP
jgi:hypothetical protein